VELRNIERAVSSGTREAGRGLKTELRRQVASAGLGQRLANSWRMRRARCTRKRRRSSAPSMRARRFGASAGACSRSNRERAKEGNDGKRISSRTFPVHRFGPLRFVLRSSGPSLLDVDAYEPRSVARAGSCEASGARPIALENGATV
jgi:hypothetical protein